MNTSSPSPGPRRMRGALAAALIIVAAAAPARSATQQTAHFIVEGKPGVDAASLGDVAARAEEVYERVSRFAGDGNVVERMRCVVFSTLEEKGLATGYTQPAHSFSGRGEIAVVTEPGFEGEVERELATLVLRRVLGVPATDLLETGLSLQFVKQWRSRDPAYWAARVSTLYGADDLGFLLDNRAARRESYLAVQAMAWAFVAHSIDRLGKRRFLAQYKTWRPDPAEIASMERDWRAYLAALRDRQHVNETPAKNRFRSVPFRKGFCFAHEGYQIYNGYLSKQADRALEKLVELGADAISLTPFTYMRDPTRPSKLPFSHGRGAENDESIVHAALAAHRLGMSVMLKPHIWLHSGWPGEIEMSDESGWNRFFDYYYRWIIHYALLAEMYDMESLCIGVELSRATVGFESRWAELVDRVRRVYDGDVVYAANWGGEFEGVTFWDLFDYIGIDCYYPLSDKESPSDGDLASGVSAILDKIEKVARRYDKRVLITEVGFASSTTPWIAPYERNREATVDLDAQTRCYEQFFRGLSGRSVIAGVYWWKWPSTLEHGGPHHSGFTPNDKPAEEVVRRWFHSMPERGAGLLPFDVHQ